MTGCFRLSKIKDRLQIGNCKLFILEKKVNNPCPAFFGKGLKYLSSDR